MSGNDTKEIQEPKRVVQAKELLKAEGYLLIPYRKIGLCIYRIFCIAKRWFVTTAQMGTQRVSKKMTTVKSSMSQMIAKRQVESIPCTKCGAELAPNVRFCTKCGTPLPVLDKAIPEATDVTVQLEPDKEVNRASDVQKHDFEYCNKGTEGKPWKIPSAICRDFWRVSGRTGRREYWITIVSYLLLLPICVGLIIGILAILNLVLIESEFLFDLLWGMGIVSSIVFSACCIPVMIRRSHDIGYSGWLWFSFHIILVVLCFCLSKNHFLQENVAILGIVIDIVLGVLPSTTGVNKYVVETTQKKKM